MSVEARTLLRPEELAPLADPWNALASGRGLQADFYDTYAWMAAWLAAAGAGVAARLRVPAVFEAGRLVALLPLAVGRMGAWEPAGQRFRVRYRPVVEGTEPREEALGLLAEQVAAAGARHLAIDGLPDRDPATGVLAGSLRRAGYRVVLRRGTTESLASVSGGWAEHHRRFRAFARHVERFLKKANQLGEPGLRVFGPGGEPAAAGFSTYFDLHARSWKGALREPWITHRRELVRRAESLGMTRVFVLEIAGVPVSADVWFRLGRVAVSYATAYDRRFTAIGPGSILLWRGHKQLFDESPPGLIDHLPGRNPQKDDLSPDRPFLITLEAARKTVLSLLAFPVRRRVRRTVHGLSERRLRRVGRPGRRRERAARVRVTTVTPAPGSPGARALNLDPPVEMYLTVAGGHRSPGAMRKSWRTGDGWWRVGEPPVALVRLGAAGPGPRDVREVVLVGPGAPDLDSILRALASAVQEPVTAALPAEGSGTRGIPVPVHRAPLPWPEARPSASRG